MIERLLEAERARTAGQPDVAETLLNQVADADPRNAIAVVGLARLALDRGDVALAEARARRALALDPDEAAARRLLDELDEIERRAAEPLEAAALPVAPAAAAADEARADAPARRGWFRRLLDRVLGRRDLSS